MIMVVQPIIIIFQNRGDIFMGTWWVRLITVIIFSRLQYLQTATRLQDKKEKKIHREKKEKPGKYYSLILGLFMQKQMQSNSEVLILFRSTLVCLKKIQTIRIKPSLPMKNKPKQVIHLTSVSTIRIGWLHTLSLVLFNY